MVLRSAYLTLFVEVLVDSSGPRMDDEGASSPALGLSPYWMGAEATRVVVLVKVHARSIKLSRRISLKVRQVRRVEKYDRPAVSESYSEDACFYTYGVFCAGDS